MFWYWEHTCNNFSWLWGTKPAKNQANLIEKMNAVIMRTELSLQCIQRLDDDDCDGDNADEDDDDNDDDDDEKRE